MLRVAAEAAIKSYQMVGKSGSGKSPQVIGCYVEVATLQMERKASLGANLCDVV